MTREELKDHFAGLAMQALMPEYREMCKNNSLEDWESIAIPELAREAYLVANEMLKAGGYYE